MFRGGRGEGLGGNILTGAQRKNHFLQKNRKARGAAGSAL